jgi:hypothetical protein
MVTPRTAGSAVVFCLLTTIDVVFASPGTRRDNPTPHPTTDVANRSPSQYTIIEQQSLHTMAKPPASLQVAQRLRWP